MTRLVEGLHAKINPQDLKRIEEGFLLSKEEDDHLRKFLQENPNFRGKLPKRSTKTTQDKHPDSPYSHSILVANDPETGERKVYAIYNELGKGAFGRVTLAQDITEPKSTEWTAVKRQRISKTSDSDPKYVKFASAVEKENTTLQELGELLGEVTRSKKIDGEEDKEIFYSVMRLGHGASLQEALFDSSDLYKLPEADLRAARDDAGLQRRMLKLMVMAQEVMREVQFIHAAGYVNRDLKVPNVLFNQENGEGKVIDHGFAIKLSEIKKLQEEREKQKEKILEDLDKINGILPGVASKYNLDVDPGTDEGQKIILNKLRENRTALTEDEIFVLDNYDELIKKYWVLEDVEIKGTEPYVAPESHRGEYSFASDVYAQGVLLLHILGDFVVTYENDKAAIAESMLSLDFEPGIWSVIKNNLGLEIPPELRERINSLPDQDKADLAANLTAYFELEEKATFPPAWEEQGWKPLMEEVMKMVSSDPANRPSVTHSADLFATKHIELLHKLGLHSQAKFAEQEKKLIAEEIKLRNQLQGVSTPAEKEILKDKIAQMKELRQKVHHIVVQDPIKTQDLVLLADAVIVQRVLDESKPPHLRLPSAVKEIALDLQDNITSLLSKDVQKKVAEVKSFDMEEKRGNKSPMFDIWQRREIANKENKPPSTGPTASSGKPSPTPETKSPMLEMWRKREQADREAKAKAASPQATQLSRSASIRNDDGKNKPRL